MVAIRRRYYRLIEEERWKGDYEGHIRETPRDLGDDEEAWFKRFYSGNGM